MTRKRGIATSKRRKGALQTDTVREADHMTQDQLAFRTSQIKHKLLVLSGKGGVGKSTIAVQLAIRLAHRGDEVGLLNVDLHGPSIPYLLGINHSRIHTEKKELLPIQYGEHLRVISIGNMLEGQDTPVIWRGPLKMRMIRQFLTDVRWGALDWLIVDSPPGTGDEPLSIAQLLPDVNGAIIVTTPQRVSVVDVRRCVQFCRKLQIPIMGVVENMSGFLCPVCHTRTDIFKSGGGVVMAAEMGIPLLGRVPLDLQVVQAGDQGNPMLTDGDDSPVAQAFDYIADHVCAQIHEPEDRLPGF